MNLAMMLAAEAADELPPANVLEWSFLAALIAVSGLLGVLALVVVARMVEPRGVKVLLRRIAGKA